MKKFLAIAFISLIFILSSCNKESSEITTNESNNSNVLSTENGEINTSSSTTNNEKDSKDVYINENISISDYNDLKASLISYLTDLRKEDQSNTEFSINFNENANIKDNSMYASFSEKDIAAQTTD
jgi:hypothetical protein